MASYFGELNAALADLGSSVSKGLVRVRSGHRGAGAGTIWHPDGLIVTAAHVLDGGPYSVRLHDGVDAPATLLASDRQRDVAALTIQASGLPTVPLGDSRLLRAGQWVGGLGYPWGHGSRLIAGSVAGIDDLPPEFEQLPGHGQREDSKRQWVIVNLRLRPGFSGGPLFDAGGRLVGINTVMTGPAIGAAVPVDAAKRFLAEVLPDRASAA